jgi:hypothetical protein
MRLLDRSFVIVALGALSVAPAVSQQKEPLSLSGSDRAVEFRPNDSLQDARTTLAGKWRGAVKADVGEMPIEVVITVEKGKASGTIRTFHGELTIREGVFADGKWVLPFGSPDGSARGKMSGVLKGDGFSGEWDFRPQAIGTFSLTRVK